MIFQQYNKVFDSLEKWNAEKYPPCVKHILIECGYDKLMGLAELNEQKISKIEKHVNKNRAIIEKMDCCNSETYKGQAEFCFIPGHESIILAIPKQITQLKEKRSQKLKAKGETNKSEDVLKTTLIRNLIKFAQKKGLVLPEGVISERNIVDFKCEHLGANKVFKCGFSCPFCATVIPVFFKSFWRSSNASSHLKDHINGADVQLMEIQEVAVV